MCGVVGCFGGNAFGKGSARTLRATRLLAHRGPDALATWSLGDAFLGQTRLAFHGNELNYPVEIPGGRYVLLLNGEIYNFEDLAKRYGLSSAQVRAGGDAWVATALFEMSGLRAVQEFEGHFSIALFDKELRQLHLIRDAVGSKPLYFAQSPEMGWIFASELKALQAYDPDILRDVNTAALATYLMTQNLYATQTIHKNVQLVSSGTIVTLRKSEKAFTEFTFRDLQPQTEWDAPNSDWDSLIREEVRKQLPNEDFSLFLSGGIDSSLLAIMAVENGQRPTTVNVSFPASTLDEGEQARKLASHLGLEMRQVILYESEFWDLLPQVISCVEEPRLGQSVNNFVANREVGNATRVVMSGAGGDEIFAGYPWRYPSEEVDCRDFKRALSWVSRKQVRLDYRALGLSPDYIEVGRENLMSWLEAEVQLLADSRLHSRSSGLMLALNVDQTAFLQSLLLVEDRLAMAFGIEVRAPLASTRLWRLRHAIPENQLLALQGGERVGKMVLRNLVASKGFVDIAKRPKQGFTAPDSEWLKSTKFLDSLSRDSELWAFISRRKVLSMWDRHRQTGSYRAELWSVLVLVQLFDLWRLRLN